MEIEFLFWEGCPSHERALSELRDALRGHGLDPERIVVTEISTDAQAAAEHFVGSPTIRIDGVDVQTPQHEPTGLTCRVYLRRDGRVSPTPDPADIDEALRAAAMPEAVE
jgi:hypothetical protein